MSTAPASPRSVLFVDESNTRLSFMAEHVTRARWGDAVRVASAGWDVREPAASERAFAALATCGIVAAGHRPRRLRDVDVASFDTIVAMSRAAVDKLPRTARLRAIVWTIADPWQGTDEVYTEVLVRLAAAVDGLLSAPPAPLESGRPPAPAAPAGSVVAA